MREFPPNINELTEVEQRTTKRIYMRFDGTDYVLSYESNKSWGIYIPEIDPIMVILSDSDFSELALRCVAAEECCKRRGISISSFPFARGTNGHS